MTYKTLNPLRDLIELSEGLSRLFEERRREGPGEAPLTASWAPPVDIYETPEAVVLWVELPGLTREDIKLSVEDRTLTLSGEKKPGREVDPSCFHRSERTYGRFARSFSVPANLDHLKVQARMVNGVLEVHLPKREETRPRQVEIRVQ